MNWTIAEVLISAWEQTQNDEWKFPPGKFVVGIFKGEIHIVGVIGAATNQIGILGSKRWTKRPQSPQGPKPTHPRTQGLSDEPDLWAPVVFVGGGSNMFLHFHHIPRERILFQVGWKLNPQLILLFLFHNFGFHPHFLEHVSVFICFERWNMISLLKFSLQNRWACL